MNKKFKVFSFGVGSLLGATIAVLIFFSYQILWSPISSDTTEIVFEVSPGSNLINISNKLFSYGLIRHSRIFQTYAKFKGQANKFKVGEYSLNRTMTPDQIMAVLVSGKSRTKNFTIAEGLNLYDIADLIEKHQIGTKAEFFKLVRDPIFIKSLLNENLPSLEGYLFPETYLYSKFDDLKSVIAQMVKRFLQVWSNIEPMATHLGWTRNQIVTFASIVEKETGAVHERPLVASVFHNRLQKKMRLQTDPTVLYGMALKLGKMPNNITKKDLLTPTTHNTYTNFGLPPTPIASPGKDALMATIQPAKTEYLFFVSQNNGTHVFSENIQQHNKAVQDFQLNRKARENKSWRDLNQ